MSAEVRRGKAKQRVDEPAVERGMWLCVGKEVGRGGNWTQVGRISAKLSIQ
jgi:hypothetical protein